VSLIVESDPVPLRMDEGGTLRVGQTRVTLESVIEAFRDGATAEEIVHRYTSLALPDVYAVIAYYLRHRSEVDTCLQQCRREADDVRRVMESRFGADGLRERLLARRRGESPD
jgi:uncharacterized protein (DUF433 family)